MTRLRLARPHQILLLLIALTLIRGLIYAAVMPPWWMGHDEDFHFAQVKGLIARQLSDSSSPNPDWSQEITASFTAFPLSRWSHVSEGPINPANVIDRHSQLTRPSLAYYPYTWPGQLIINQDIIFQLFALRTVSVIITTGTILFAFLCAQQVFSSLSAQLLVVALILFNPSFMIIGSAINDGNLTVLFITIVFYLLLLEFKGQRITWRLGAALLLTLLAIFTKTNAIFMLGVWIILGIRFVRKADLKSRLVIIIGSGLLTFLTWLYFDYLPNFVRGKFLLARNYFAPDEIVPGLEYVFSFRYFRDTFASYWTILGHAVYWLDPVWYNILFIFTLFTIAGMLLYGWRWLKNKRPAAIQPQYLLLSLLMTLVFLGGLFGVSVLRYEAQAGRLARYIFPAIVPVSILMVAGWRELLPQHWRNIGYLLLFGLMFLFDTMVWLNHALPWYYPFWP